MAAGLAMIADLLGPPFVLEPGVIVRDSPSWQADIDRAVGPGLFSSIDTYGALLPGRWLAHL